MVIGGIWLLFWLVPKIYELLHVPAPTQTPPSSSGQSYPQPSPGTTYRPKPRQGTPKIKFGTPSPNPTPSPPSDVRDLHDAFTGAPLNPALGLHQCTNCQVYYHSESIVVLRKENAGRCVACGSKTLVARGAQEPNERRGRDHDPHVITLANFRSHFGRVVTFESAVREVKKSKSGKGYALMFEHAPWTRGLKLVFLQGSIANVGGVTFIKRLHGRHLRVRGLLVRHPIFGPQIIVSERNMILDIR